MSDQAISEQESPASEPTGGGLMPGQWMERFSDRAVIIYGHVAAVVLGLLYWNFRSNNSLYRTFMEFGTTGKDIDNLAAYGLPVAGGLIIVLHVLAWWVVVDGGAKSRRKVLASLCRAMWPALLGVPGLLMIFHHSEKRDLLQLIWLPPFGLTVGMIFWRFYEYLPKSLPEKEPFSEPQPDKPPPALVWGGSLTALVVLYILWFCYLTFNRHWSFGTCLHDFSIYDQLMWNTMNGRWFECGMFRSEWMGYELHKFGNHFFAEHFIPTFWIITPLYWLFPRSETVLAAQSLMLGLAAVPVFFIALRKLRSRILGIAFAAAFLVHPVVQQSNLKDVHIDTFAPLFLLGAFAAYMYKRHILYWVLLVLALGCKEEVAVSVALMGLFLVFGEKDRKIGIATLVTGLVYFFVVTGFVIPWFRDGLPVRQLDRYGHLLVGQEVERHEITIGMLIKSMLLNPIHTVTSLLTETRLRGIMLQLTPLAALALWGRWTWLWLFPVALITLFTGYPVQHGMEQHYGIPLISALVVASIYGMWWLLRRDLPEDAPLPMQRITGGTIALGIVVLFTYYEFGFTPFGKRYEAEHWEVLAHNELAYTYMDEIPDDAVISVQLELGAQLANRRFIYLFPEVTDDVEFIFLDTRAYWWPFPDDGEQYREEVMGLLESDEWGLVLPYEDGFLLFRRGHSTELNEDALEFLDFERYRKRRYGT